MLKNFDNRGYIVVVMHLRICDCNWSVPSGYIFTERRLLFATVNREIIQL
jgi:hypothetical protein